MAKKIRTFQEYDSARRERELNLPQAVQSKLEQMMLANVRKTERELGLGVRVLEIMVHPQEFMRAMTKGPQELMRLYREQQREKYMPQAELEIQLNYFQQNMHELIVSGVSQSKASGSLDDDQKQSFYSRFLDNVKELTDSRHFAPFKTKYYGVEDLVRGFHPPEREDEFETVTTVTNGLCRERYITRENA
ncbi:MAG: hypothetical protein Q7K45_05005, partial [Nanoarchaeota archaeon]|nr:hypothetical protein [Nanoarchaeota archaeon]